MEDRLKLKDGRLVSSTDYVECKTKDLIEFGYSNLTTKEVKEQLLKVLNNSSDLTVIGMFIKADLR